MNKKYYIIVFSLLLFSFVSQSQERHHNCDQDKQKIKSEKVSFITEKINLTVEEAQQFWPIYNEFANKSDKLFEEERGLKRQIRHERDKLSNNELLTIADRLIDIKIERAQLEKEYHIKYKEILSSDKLLSLYEAEFGFRRHLLRKYKNHSCAEEE
jgi:hypothetical protein